MRKDLTNLLFARFSKKEIEEKHPDWLVDFGGVKFIKNDVKEKLKDILLEKIIKRAREQRYYIFDRFEIRETENSFYVLTLAHPRFTPDGARLISPPKSTPEEIEKIFKEKLEEIGIRNLSL